MFVTPPQQPHQTDNAAATRRPNAERGDGHNSQTQTPADLFLARNCEAARHEDRIHESTLFECVATESTVLFLDDNCFATVTINPQSNKSNRKQKTENRKQKTENRKRKTENTRVENREQKTENREQKTETENRKPKTESNNDDYRLRYTKR